MQYFYDNIKILHLYLTSDTYVGGIEIKHI